MIIKKSDELTGPRTFFTLIDKNNTAIVSNWNDYIEETDNILKVLLLTKESLVVACSNLCDEKTYKYFNTDETKALLFKEKIIKPAIRDEFNSFSEVFANKQIGNNNTLPEDIDKFFTENIKEAVAWNLNDNSNWYKNYILSQINQEDSLIRKSLRDIDSKSELLFVNLVKEEVHEIDCGNRQYFNRDAIVENISRLMNKKSAYASIQFLDLIYHISGSRVVNCENYVPQENLISYNHLTNSFNKTHDESSIFLKSFINTILDIICENSFSSDIISNLSFREILDLRKANEPKAEAFRLKYEKCLSLITKSTNTIDKDLLYVELKDLHETGLLLREEFRTKVLNEIQPYKELQKKVLKQNKLFNCVQNSIDFSGIFIPGLSAINFLFNNCKLKEWGYIKKAMDKKRILNENEMRTGIKDEFGHDPIFISFINDLVKLHKNKYMNIEI